MTPTEKLDLAFKLIQQWNDTSTTKIAPTNSVFRVLTRLHSHAIRDWIRSHEEDIKAELHRHGITYTYSQKGLWCQHNRNNNIGEAVETIQKQIEASKTKLPIEERLDTLEKQIGILIKAFKKI